MVKQSDLNEQVTHARISLDIHSELDSLCSCHSRLELLPFIAR